jgi:hypothetical protein
MLPVVMMWQLLLPAVFAHAAGPAVSPGQSRIVETATPTIARMAHTATPLADGRILVAGGFTDPAQAAHSAELYDPGQRRFVPLPRMIVPRHSHSSTLLSDGRVLIAGGYDVSNRPVATVERFDPVRGRFERVGSMTEPRAGHLAFRLPDGTVLLAGGVGPSWRFLASAELYDANTNRFTPVGAMSVPRESHAGALLRDGRVLIVGGHRDRREAITLYRTAEVYDPVRRRFFATGSMHIRRHKHDALRLADGRVLVSGGSDERDDLGAYRSTELYDPTTGRFTPGPEMQLARYKHERTSVLLDDGRVLLGGGARAAEVMDVASGRSALVPSPSPLAGQFSAVAPMRNQRVLLTGGYGNGAGPRQLAWEFVP